MDISSAIVSSAMDMQAMQTATQYATGVMAMEMDAMEDISSMLVEQMLSLDVGASPNQIDMMV
ncbi:MAG: hypothetical protein HDQ87_06055 [Clostridia bacterium]|nr:hypothetical protein [Clostridia bacterium]